MSRLSLTLRRPATSSSAPTIQNMSNPRKASSDIRRVAFAASVSRVFASKGSPAAGTEIGSLLIGLRLRWLHDRRHGGHRYSQFGMRFVKRTDRLHGRPFDEKRQQAR